MKTWFWGLCWLLSILTITGNGFIIFLVCTKRQLRTKTNAFVVSLAVADFCVGMSVVPSLIICNVTETCNWPQDGLSWADMIRWLFGFASVTNLCSLVLDRYIAVVKPFKYLTFMNRRRVSLLLFVSWVMPVVSRILPVLSVILSASPIRTGSVLETVNVLIFMTLFEIFPCFMLIFWVGSMIHIVYKQDRYARILAKQIRFNHHVLYKSHEKTTLKIMLIVVGLFLMCYSIFISCSVLLLSFNFTKKCNDTEYKIPLLVLNSAINPLAYALLKRDIKKEVKKVTYVVRFKQEKWTTSLHFSWRILSQKMLLALPDISGKISQILGKKCSEELHALFQMNRYSDSSWQRFSWMRIWLRTYCRFNYYRV